MLVVKVEIWPYGSKEHRYEVGRLSAGNITDCGEVCSYEIRLSDRGGLVGGRQTVEFQVEGHDRSDGFWPLVHKALTKAMQEGLIPIQSRSE
jgi:hypothetical protein